VQEFRRRCGVFFPPATPNRLQNRYPLRPRWYCRLAKGPRLRCACLPAKAGVCPRLCCRPSKAPSQHAAVGCFSPTAPNPLRSLKLISFFYGFFAICNSERFIGGFVNCGSGAALVGFPEAYAFLALASLK
jgi:hypothetical protein